MTAQTTLPAGKSTKTGFISATASFVTVFAAGSTAIPLFGSYRAQNGITDTQLSLVAAGYFVCAVSALLFLGRLSNHFGRKPVSIAALLLAAAGCLVLTTVDGFWPLFAGRALQGVAAGIASSALAAFAVDTAPARPKWLVAAVTTTAATVGLSFGVFAAGALVQFAPAPRQASYVAFAAALGLCALGVGLAPETVTRRRGALASLRPEVRVPAAARPYLPMAACVFVSTWAVGGFFNAFGPSVAVDYLGSRAPLVAAAVFASYMAPGVLAGPLSGRTTSASAQRLGMALFASAVLGLAASTALGSAALFIGCGVLGGLGAGLAMNGSMASLLGPTSLHERAGLLSLVYAVSYTGSAVPALVAGQLVRGLSLFAVTCGYAVLAVLACIAVLLGTRPVPQDRH